MFTRKLQLPLLNVTDADTLVFISPNTSPNPPHRVSSKALLASGSAVFKELLGPTSQHRALRKRKLVHNLPQGIKYVLDLSPPEEGPEALNAVLKLYCPKVVLEWQSGVTNGAYLEDDDHRYQRELWQVNRRRRAKGLNEHGTWETMEENYDSIPDVYIDEDQIVRWGLEAEDAGAEAMNDEWIEPAPPAAHSTRRHSAAIERVLHILHGLDPQLCTTPMWYTVCKVAVLLNCESAVVDHATSWLYADGKFIGRYPEIVMEVGNDLKSKVLFKDAFALLVGKMLRTTESDYEQDAHCFDSIPEAALPWKRNIMHACWSLKERVQTTHGHLMRTHEWLYNSERISEYAELDRIFSIPNLDHEVYEASIALRDAFTDAVVNKLAPFLKGSYLSEGHPRCDSPLFTRSFWHQLGNLFTEYYWEFDENVSNAQHAWEQCVRGYNVRRIKGKCPHSEQSEPPERRFEILSVRGVITHDETPKSELSRIGGSQPLPAPRRIASHDEKRPDRPDSQTLPDDFNALDFQQDEDIHPPSYKPSSEPPPSYTCIDGTGERLVTEGITPRGMRIEIANPIKRKSVSEYSWDGEVAGEVASKEETGSITPRMGNSSKRRCSLEKPQDGEASVCSVSTVAGYEHYGESEFFRISDLHEEIDYQIAPLNCDRKGKGKAIDFECIQELPKAEEPQGSSLRVHSGPTGSIAKDDSPIQLGAWAKGREGLRDHVLDPSLDERDLFQELIYGGSGNPESSRAVGAGAHAALDHTLYNGIAAQNQNCTQGYSQDCSSFADPAMTRYPSNRGFRHNIDQELPLPDPPEISSSLYIALGTIWNQALRYVRSISSPFAEMPTMYDPTSWPDDNFLLCLSDAEWKFLPLWADGLDDDTGGVFGDPLPEPVPQSPPEDCGEGTEVESLADSNYSDCLLDMESVASFEVRVFSEDEDEDMDGSGSVNTAEDESEYAEWDGDSDDTEELGWEECF